jgi:hypothetical protein
MWRRVYLVWIDVSEERIAPFADFSTLKMEAIRSFEKSLHTGSTRRHISQNGIFHSHRCKNLKSYIILGLYNEITLSRKPLGIGHMYIYIFLLRMTDTMTSQNTDLSSWNTLYTGIWHRVVWYINTEFRRNLCLHFQSTTVNKNIGTFGFLIGKISNLQTLHRELSI